MFWKVLHQALVGLLHVERRFDPFFRPVADALFKEPVAALIQCLINLQRKPEGLAIAEERAQPGEDQALETIIRTMSEYMRTHWQPGNVQRAGNSKTHGVVHGEVTILEGIAEPLRRGIFAKPKTYPAWIRFAGPGPDWPPDIDDVGVLSCSIKLMGVPGAKLLDDEKATQDLLGISIPTFTTPNVFANAKLQSWILKELPLYYFLDPTDSHVLDALMQGLWSKTQSNPLGERYWSCVPYLLGEGQAMKYSIVPRSTVARHIPNLPLRPPENYLRDNMVRTLADRDVEFDIMGPAPDRSLPHADRGRLGPLAGEAVALRSGRARGDPPPALRLAGPARLCQEPLVQSLALPGRAPAAGQPEARPPQALRRPRRFAPTREHGAAYRAERNRGVLALWREPDGHRT